MREAIHVLVVDDDDDVRETLEIVLETAGFTVSTAPDGMQALERLRTSNAPHVVLLDLRMPVMSGWEVIEVLRAEGRLEQQGIIICTSSPQDAPEGFEVVAKPLTVRTVTAVIERVMRGQRARDSSSHTE